MDVKTLIRELSKRDDVTLKQGTKHLRVMTADGSKQLAVITGGSKSDVGRDVDNTLAMLRRHGINLGNGTRRERKADAELEEKCRALKEDVEAAQELLGVGTTYLAERIFEGQDRAVMGGQKFGSAASVRSALNRLLHGEGMTRWMADLTELTLQQVLAAEAERQTSSAPQEEIIVFRGRPAIVVALDGTRTFVDGGLEAARLTLVEMREELITYYRYQRTEAFPDTKGVYARMADWFRERAGLEIKAAALARFLGVQHKPSKSLAEVFSRAADAWAETRSEAYDVAEAVMGPQPQEPEPEPEQEPEQELGQEPECEQEPLPEGLTPIVRELIHARLEHDWARYVAALDRVAALERSA